MRKYKRLQYGDRRKIEKLYKEGKWPKEIAEIVGVHFATVYTELLRGRTGRMDENGRDEYSAELAQKTIYKKITARREGKC